MSADGITSVIIEWKGPYTLEQVKELGVGNGIYLLTGQKKRSRSYRDQLQYCGITERGFYDRLCRNHPKREMIRPDSLGIWLGQVLHPISADRSYLEHIEHCLVSFWAVHMNEKKRATNPKKPICLVSRWMRPNDKPYIRFPEPIQPLEDVLWWDTKHWRVGDLKVVAN
ncbi:hypothetical protein EJV47_22890 [Hymenobacter gummosus]|uniref:Uncharacterized protein n=1 Tax=Hymenobacter gummosus TaxID=1776032 RepID=A0A431TWJ4_9BACT|nr:hypothetical protein [Hymenobacter gummosus]RTQ46009.1 hypothetical protein EJV47_22890 [Hymenobacter gummosus]